MAKQDLRPAFSAIRNALTEPWSMPRRTRQELQFVGREAELALLRHDLTSAFAGEGGLAFIHGDPGIGKTTLARAFALEAGHRGATVLWGRGYDGGWLPPYTPWLEALSGAPDLELSHAFDDFLRRDERASTGVDATQLLDPDEARFKLHD